jgi:hypothetical protein
MSNGTVGVDRLFKYLRYQVWPSTGIMLHTEARFALYGNKPARLQVSLSTLNHVSRWYVIGCKRPQMSQQVGDDCIKSLRLVGDHMSCTVGGI